MISYKTGDLLLDDADAIVNTVNCVGVMGRGIALQFKKRFPENFSEYAKACKRDAVVPGTMFVHETGLLAGPRIIINFPTKRHWREASRIEDIQAGLVDLIRVIQQYRLKSIAIPPLGAGLGGLAWGAVRECIEKALAGLNEVDIRVFEPMGATEKVIAKNVQVPNMTPGRAALVELVHRYLSGLLDPFVSLLEIHKLMYFLQESGENLKLHYVKASYGPYAENLRHVLHVMEGHFLSGYADGGDQPDKQLRLVPGAHQEAAKFLAAHTQTLTHFDRVSQLVEGFETPFGLELLATVHWVTSKEQVQGIDNIVHAVYSWNERKKQFNPRQIELAYTVLAHKGWL